jgi:protein-tyrosine phosphatase
MGNICRSPLAEGVFKHLAAQAGVGKNFHVESFGIGAWHVGEDPDYRSQRVAQAHGIRLTSQAQQFRPKDFARFDHILALDEEIVADLNRLASGDGDRAKIRLLREYDPLADGNFNVPDPYYSNQEGFEVVYQMIRRSCEELLNGLNG